MLVGPTKISIGLEKTATEMGAGYLGAMEIYYICMQITKMIF